METSVCKVCEHAIRGQRYIVAFLGERVEWEHLLPTDDATHSAQPMTADEMDRFAMRFHSACKARAALRENATHCDRCGESFDYADERETVDLVYGAGTVVMHDRCAREYDAAVSDGADADMDY